MTIYKYFVLQFSLPALKNFARLRGAKAQLGFFYHSYRAFGALNFFCTFGGGIFSACGAQNAAPKLSLGGGAIAPIAPHGSAPGTGNVGTPPRAVWSLGQLWGGSLPVGLSTIFSGDRRSKL